ncbi:MAG: hypothetical protein KIS62_09830 [Ramlibacter sp.]|nr:hypothetical protein [Ramlibacter sp.]
MARIIGLLALAAALSACSAIKLGYNNASELVYWWLDGYLDFTDEQSPRVREDLARLHQWHRANELPRYAALLREVERLMPGDVSAQQVCAIAGEVVQRLTALSQRAEPAVVTTAMGLSPEQLQHLARRYERNNTDYRKDWLSLDPQAQQEKRFKVLLERSEMVYGSLGDPQQDVLRQQVAQSVFDARQFDAERQRRQRDALRTLRSLQQPPMPLGDAVLAMRGYLQRSRESPDPVWRQQQERLLQEGCRTFAALHNSTTAAQRDSAVRRLRAYQRDLGELAAAR